MGDGAACLAALHEAEALREGHEELLRCSAVLREGSRRLLESCRQACEKSGLMELHTHADEVCAKRSSARLCLEALHGAPPRPSALVELCPDAAAPQFGIAGRPEAGAAVPETDEVTPLSPPWPSSDESNKLEQCTRPSTEPTYERRRSNILSHKDVFPEKEDKSQRVLKYVHKVSGRRSVALINTYSAWLIDIREPPRSGRLHRLVSSAGFKGACTAVILLNGLCVSIATDQEIRHGDIGQWQLEWMAPMEMFFVVCYLAELVLKFLVHGLYFFVNEEWRWNIFDFSLVIMGLYDTVLDLLELETGANITFARLGRLLKLSKIFRVFRALRFLGSLRQMLASVVQSVAMLFWAMVLLLLMWWTLSLVILQGFSSVLQEEDLDHETKRAIMEQFGSIPKALFTLFSVSTGGDDWAATYHLVSIAGDFYAFVLLAYISFFTISLFNILTGIVVENVVTNAQLDDNDRLLLYRQTKIKLGQELKRLFLKIDLDSSGSISEDEFHHALEQHEILSIFEDNGLDPRDATMFFDILCNEAKGQAKSVDVDHFVDGFMQMRGPAAGIDMQVLRVQADQLLRRLLHQQQQLQELQEALVVLDGSLGREAPQPQLAHLCAILSELLEELGARSVAIGPDLDRAPFGSDRIGSEWIFGFSGDLATGGAQSPLSRTPSKARLQLFPVRASL